jgi:DNA-binding transcriptional LysR family regulator
METVQSLHWQLSVLSKAIHYKNLSGAASHVGLSQPQLSRIVARLEEELGVTLLDRSARRKSGWTPIAYKVADTYFTTSRKLTQALQQLTTEDHVGHLSIGTLEGLVPLATDFCQQLFDQAKLQLLEIYVYDLSELEERFEKDELDLVFTCREPGKHKYKFLRTLGYQSIERVGSGEGPRVFSPFDYASQVSQSHSKRTNDKKNVDNNHPSLSRALVSNSLAVRKLWIEEHGGQGVVPSPVCQRKTSDNDLPVVLIASDLFNTSLWQKFEQFRL